MLIESSYWEMFEKYNVSEENFLDCYEIILNGNMSENNRKYFIQEMINCIERNKKALWKKDSVKYNMVKELYLKD